MKEKNVSTQCFNFDKLIPQNQTLKDAKRAYENQNRPSSSGFFTYGTGSKNTKSSLPKESQKEHENTLKLFSKCIESSRKQFSTTNLKGNSSDTNKKIKINSSSSTNFLTPKFDPSPQITGSLQNATNKKQKSIATETKTNNNTHRSIIMDKQTGVKNAEAQAAACVWRGQGKPLSPSKHYKKAQNSTLFIQKIMHKSPQFSQSQTLDPKKEKKINLQECGNDEEITDIDLTICGYNLDHILKKQAPNADLNMQSSGFPEGFGSDFASQKENIEMQKAKDVNTMQKKKGKVKMNVILERPSTSNARMAFSNKNKQK